MRGRALAAAVVFGLVALLAPRGLREPGTTTAPPGTEPGTGPRDPVPSQPTWSEMAERVKEDRGVPMGRKAVLVVPTELVHARDRKRFLAVQVASWREDGFDRPEDSLELAERVAEGLLVPVPALGDHHILFGVGGHVEDAPFTARVQQGEVPLMASAGDAEAAAAALETLASAQAAQAVALRKQATAAARKSRAQATRLRRSASTLETQARAGRGKARAIRGAYGDPAAAERMAQRYQVRQSVATTIGPRPFDLSKPGDREVFRGRLMTTLRPPAVDMILEIAKGYEERFDRPLPISSLVRTEAYQRRLSRSNPNATLIDVAPHTTGLAFDVYDGRMSGEEQQYLLAELARREREGRLEALRENRDHVHVYVFPEGRPPDPAAVAAESRRLHAGDRPARVAAKSRTSRAKTARAAPRPARRSATAKRR
jgi:hypothetical protein